jgi:O-succinylbenzoate synthase
MAKAAVEMAAWDLFARERGEPLAQVLGAETAVGRGGGTPVGLSGQRPDRIASGVSIGIQDSIDQLLEKVDRELKAGYRRIKIKIKPGWDVNAVEAVRARFGPIPLMVDANAAYSLADATRLAELDRFDLMMIEQPLDYDDIGDHARLQRQLRTPICLDESIKSVRLAAEAIDARACGIINIKPGRVGGFGESIRLHDLCAARGIPVWHGGMLESGVGRTANIHLSTLPNFTLPGDVAASKRYFVPDLIDPPVEVAADGTIAVPSGPGLGVAFDADRVHAATIRRTAVDAPSVSAIS